MSTIEIKNVSKSFAKTAALKNVSLTLEANRIYGLLGRNGAGKTTLLNIITNKIFADEGEVLIDGETAVENDNAQSKIFHMNDKNIHPIEMKVKEGLKWAKEFYSGFDSHYAYELSQKFSLNLNKKINALSTGFNTIFKLILTLSSNAPVLLFDEPILGLDANSRELFYRELIACYSKNPKTIVVSTHLIDEISNIIESAVIIKNGEIVLTKPVEEILKLGYTVSGDGINVKKFTEGKNVIHTETIGRLMAATVFQEHDNAEKDAIKELELETTPASLQELFIRLTNS